MKIGTIVKYLLGLLAAVVIAAVVVLMVIDFNDYKPEIKAQVKQATGRELTIDGDIEVALSLYPALAVSGVSFANAEWGSRPAMATIDSLEAQIALLPLLSGTIDIRKVILKGADILLETNAKGEANYRFETATAEKPKDAPAGAPQLPLVRAVDIEKSRVTLKDAASKKTIVLYAEELSLKGGGVDGPLDLVFEGAYNENPIKASGTIGAPSEIMTAGKPWPVALTVEAGGAKADLKGAIADVVAARGLDLALAAEGENLATLSEIAGAPLPPLGPYSLKAKLSGDIDNVVKLSDMALKIGGSDLSGAVSANLKGKRPAIEGALQSNRIDIADFVKPGGPEAAKQGSSPSGGKPARDDGRVFPDDPLPVDLLKAADANLKLTIGTLIAAVEAKDVALGLNLKGGDLTVAPFKGVVADGAIDGRVRLNAARPTPALDTKLAITKFDAGKFLADMAITDLLEGTLSVDIDVKGQGGSVRALMAGLNGKTQVLMGAGRMKSTALDTYIGGPSKILTELFVGKQSEYTVINCAVSQFDIKDGLATSKALLFDTDYVTIIGEGTINLATEALDLEVDPRPKTTTVNTAVPVVITGTLANPSYGVNKLAAARKVGGLIGGIAFPPALIVGLAEMGTGGDNPCLKDAKGQPAPAQDAPNTPQGAESGENPLKSIEKGVGGTLKKLFGN